MPHMSLKRSLTSSLKAVIFSAFVIAGNACVSIPREAPELSAELGKRINAIEAAHLALLRKYFDERRDRLDDFVFREWVPIFAEEAFAEPLIQRTWDAVVRSDDPNDRLQLTIRLGPRIQQRINARVQELRGPLDDLEKAMERRLRDDYAQVKAMNNSITTFLMSATDVAETRDRYLEMFGMTDQHVGATLDSLDEAVRELLRVREDGETALQKSDEFTARIRALVSGLRQSN